MSSTVYKFINPLIKKLLDSPIHPFLSGRIIVIHFTGVKTGKKYSTPVSYYQENNTVYCFTNGVWWNNFKSGAEVEVKIKGVTRAGHAIAETTNDANKTEIMKKYFSAIPSDAKYYGVRFNSNGEPNREDVVRATTAVVMIKITLK